METLQQLVIGFLQLMFLNFCMCGYECPNFVAEEFIFAGTKLFLLSHIHFTMFTTRYQFSDNFCFFFLYLLMYMIEIALMWMH